MSKAPLKWANASVGVGAVCYADGHIYLRGENGTVALVEANSAEYKELRKTGEKYATFRSYAVLGVPQP